MTPETNRFTILLNNMRVMGIFDWWIAVLDFIAKNPENPNPKGLDEILEAELRNVRGELNKIYVQVVATFSSLFGMSSIRGCRNELG